MHLFHKQKYVLLSMLFCFVAIISTACGKEEAPVTIEGHTLTITSLYWNDMGGGEPSSAEHTVLTEDDIIYGSSFGHLQIKYVDEEEIILKITDGGFVYKDPDSLGIDLNADPLKEIPLDSGDSVTIASTTMDAGVTLTISYE